MPLAHDLSVADVEAPVTEPPLETGSREGGRFTAQIDAIGEDRAPALAALPGLGRLLTQGDRVDAHDHVLVLGGDALSLALLMWRGGFTNVGCAPRNLDCVAHGIAEALIVSQMPRGEEMDRLLARARFALKDGGWLLAAFDNARHISVPHLYGRLTASGFVADELASDGRGGLWLAARKRAHLRLVPARGMERAMAGSRGGLAAMGR
ncbi:hypothetical protein [Azorhizobium caulinodans]|nr:hypothetical protein [Azorhizobium caulinodans]